MKKTILILLIGFLSIPIFAQPDSTLIFDLSTMASDTAHFYDVAGLETTRGALHVKIRFDSLDCDGSDLLFDAGTAFTDTDPAAYPVSYSELSFPLPLDTTATRPAPNTGQLLFSRYKFDGVNKWNFMLKFEHDRGYIVYTLVNTNPTGCTEGEIWRIR